MHTLAYTLYLSTWIYLINILSNGNCWIQHGSWIDGNNHADCNGFHSIKCSPMYTIISVNLKIVQILVHVNYHGILWHSAISKAPWFTNITPGAQKHEFKTE